MNFEFLSKISRSYYLLWIYRSYFSGGISIYREIQIILNEIVSEHNNPKYDIYYFKFIFLAEQFSELNAILNVNRFYQKVAAGEIASGMFVASEIDTRI